MDLVKKTYIDYIMDYNIGYNIWISIYGFPGIPGGDPWIPWGDRWDLGTDGTLGPMGPGPQGPPILPPRILPPRILHRYPGARSPATQARCRLPGCWARCRLPAAGPAIFQKIFLKNFKNCSTDSRDQNKNLNFSYKKIIYVCVFMLASISAITAL